MATSGCNSGSSVCIQCGYESSPPAVIIASPELRVQTRLLSLAMFRCFLLSQLGWRGAAGLYLIGAKEESKHFTMYRTTPNKTVIQAQGDQRAGARKPKLSLHWVLNPQGPSKQGNVTLQTEQYKKRNMLHKKNCEVLKRRQMWAPEIQKTMWTLL